MTVFDDMMADLFADPNMAADAVWTPAGGSAATVRILQAAPDEVVGPFEVKAKASPIRVQIRIAEAPTLAEGDALEITAAQSWMPSGNYTILAPEADADRLCWRMSLKRA